MTSIIQNYLSDQGFGIIAQPRPNLEVLGLLTMSGSELSALNAPLGLLFKPDVEPMPGPKFAVPNFSGSRAFDLNMDADLGFMAGLFQQLGIGGATLGAKGGHKRGLKAVFSFEELSIEEVNELDLDNFLSGAVPVENEFRTNTEKLMHSELYVITGLLRASKFSIQLFDEAQQSVELDAELPQSANARFSFKRDRNNTLSFSQDSGPAMAFGFKAHQIFYDKKRWFEFWKADEAGFRLREKRGVRLRGEGGFPALDLGNRLANI